MISGKKHHAVTKMAVSVEILSETTPTECKTLTEL